MTASLAGTVFALNRIVQAQRNSWCTGSISKTLMKRSSLFPSSPRIGAKAHIPSAFIGFSVAISNVAAVVSAIAVVWAAQRLRALFIGGLLAGIAGYALMAVPSPQHFLISVCLYNLAWGISLPIFLTLIRAVDFTNRLFVAGSATVFLPAVVVGPRRQSLDARHRSRPQAAS
jgi:hypothetical protein